MSLYRIDYTDGRPTTYHATYGEALAALDGWGEGVEVGHDGDLMDGGDRTLAWLNAEDAQDDDGARAFASIRAEVEA